MKSICKKIADVIKIVFGYGIMLTLFLGGLTFFGYIAALIIGGSIAASICAFIYEVVFSIIIYITTILVLLGLVSMYLSGESELTASSKKEEAKK